MNSPAEIIHQLLVDLEVVQQSGDWPAYVSFMPADPDEAVCLYDMSGEDDGRLMNGPKIHHAGVQVMIRSKTYSNGWAKANEIALALDNQNRSSIAIESSANYILHNATRRGTIHPLGISEDDDERRHNFTINMVVTVSQTT